MRKCTEDEERRLAALVGAHRLAMSASTRTLLESRLALETTRRWHVIEDVHFIWAGVDPSAAFEWDREGDLVMLCAESFAIKVLTYFAEGTKQ